MNIFALLEQAATRFADRGAVFNGNTQLLTFSKLHQRALQLAASLRGHFPSGERIAVYSENKPAYVEIMFGIWAAGMVVTPVNAKLHPKEVRQILEDSGARLLLVSSKLASEIEPELSDFRAAGGTVVPIGTPAYENLFETRWDGDKSAEPDALAWLFYTSGTTGRSKGAMLSHRNLMAMTIAHLADIDDASSNGSLIHAAPMSHGSGLYIPAFIARGARQVVPMSAGFDPHEFIGLCSEHPDCSVFFAPTMVQRLRLAVEQGAPLPTRLKTIVYGGGPMYVEELRKSLSVFGNVFAQIYGQGESPMTITGTPKSAHLGAADDVLGSVGYARSGVEVAVVDQQGNPLPPGEVGEITCRGDVVMLGYWNNPEATAATLKNGWLHTGDMGSFDEKGFLTLRDRSKDVVISGGTNIYPREVEEVLLKHPGVGEVCVVGQPNSEWGEIVVAFIVPSAGNAPSFQDLDKHCNDNIARFKRPKRYLFVEGLPKNNYGKVLKRELRDRLTAEKLENARIEDAQSGATA